jgi:putative transposase
VIEGQSIVKEPASDPNVKHKLIYRAYKTELHLNNKERSLFEQCAGLARFAYNWGLRQKMDAYEATGRRPTYVALNRQLNALKKSDFYWMYQYPSCIPQAALQDLEQAFRNYFRQLKAGEKAGPPRFKSRKHSPRKIRLQGAIRVEARRIRLPRIGWIRLKERGYLPTKGVKILWATVSQWADRWFVSLQVQEEIPSEDATGPIVGIDLGILTLATCSDGRRFANPHALRNELKKLARLNRELFRRRKGSRNWEKTRRKLTRLHYRIACIRREAVHQATSSIVATSTSAATRPAIIALEDLNVTGLMRSRQAAQAIADVGMGMFREQMIYKSDWYGSQVHLVDRWFASSKQCSGCGHVKEKLSLSSRMYRCQSCGLTMDRDLNAAKNLASVARDSTETTASSAESDACGEPAHQPVPGTERAAR